MRRMTIAVTTAGLLLAGCAGGTPPGTFPAPAASSAGDASTNGARLLASMMSAPRTSPAPGSDLGDMFTQGLSKEAGGFVGTSILNAFGVHTEQQLQATSLANMQQILTTLQTSMTQVLASGTAIIQGLSSIQQQLSVLVSAQASTVLAEIVDPQDTAYQMFNNALIDASSPTGYFPLPEILSNAFVQAQIAQSAGCIQQSSGQFQCTGLGALYGDAVSLVGLPGPAGGLVTEPNLADDVFRTIGTQGVVGFPQAGTAAATSYSMATALDQNNQTVVGYLTQFATVLQANYTMMASLLVLEYCAAGPGGSVPALCTQEGNPTWTTPISNPGLATPSPSGSISPFALVDFPWSGYSDQNSLQQNLTALNNDYTSMFNTLGAAADAQILSDSPLQPAPAGTSWPTTHQVSTLPGMPGGNWSTACAVYVWSGLFGDADGFTGTWDGLTLQPECGGSNGIQLAFSRQLSSCSPAPVTLGLTAASNSYGLTCAGGMDVSGIDMPAFPLVQDSGHIQGYQAGTNFVWQWPGQLSPVTDSMWTVGGMTVPVASTSASMKMYHQAANPTLQVVLQIDSGNGFLGPVLLTVNDNKDSGSWEISTYIACLPTDPLCGVVTDGSICYAGYPMTFDDSNVLQVGTLGSCTIPDPTPAPTP